MILQTAIANSLAKNEHRQPQTAALSKAELDRLKWLFLDIARQVCPAFTVRQEMKQTLSDIVRWCALDPSGPLDTARGLWLWGNIGTGKSTMLEIVRRFCAQVRPLGPKGFPYSFRTTNAIEVCAAFQLEGYAGIETFITSPRQAFDELGSETIPTSYYGNAENVIQYVLQRRYDRRDTSFTHATTNLSPRQIADVYGPRIYDRAKEMFNFVNMPGATFRKN